MSNTVKESSSSFPLLTSFVSPAFIKQMLGAGLSRIEVEVVEYPITDRYCSKGLICTLDMKNSQIRCSGAWFTYDDRWKVKPCA